MLPTPVFKNVSLKQNRSHVIVWNQCLRYLDPFLFLQTQVIFYFFQGIFPDRFELRRPYLESTVIPSSQILIITTIHVIVIISYLGWLPLVLSYFCVKL